MDDLSSRGSIRDVRRALGSLPHGIRHFYENSIARIRLQSKENAQLALRCLSWLFFAREPLTSRQLRHALSVELIDEDLDESGIYDFDFLANLCSGLLHLDHEAETVHFAHFTVQEYLATVADTIFHGAERYIGIVCLTYLSFKEFRTGPIAVDTPSGQRNFRKRNDVYVLHKYASKHWGHHIQKYQSDNEVLHHSMRFLLSDNLIRAAWQHCYLGAPEDYYPFRFSALHATAVFGLLKICKVLIEVEKQDVNALDSLGHTPLIWVARRGSAASAQFLIDAGADLRLRGTNLAKSKFLNDYIADLSIAVEETALYIAVAWLNVAVVEAIIKSGYEPQYHEVVEAANCSNEVVRDLVMGERWEFVED